MTDQVVSWSTNNADVAEVSVSGLVTAVSNGSATLVATSGSANATVTATVAQLTTTVSLSVDSVSFTSLGDTIAIGAIPLDANGVAVEDGRVVWVSSDANVAVVDTAGVVTSVAEGAAVVTATSGSGIDSVAVSVMQVGANVAVSPTPVTLSSLGDTVRLSAVVQDARGRPLPAADVSWASSAPGVAAVDSSGRVSAVGNGVATVTAMSGDAVGSASISVAQVATSFTLSPEARTFTSLGDTLQLLAAARDEGGSAITDPVTAWSSSDTRVATVSVSGLVTSVGNGSATITASSTGTEATSAISVDQQAASLVLSDSALTFAALGDTAVVVAAVRDENEASVEDATISWASSDGGVASVDQSGRITALANGSAVVTATSGVATSSLSVAIDQVPALVALSRTAVDLPALGDTITLTVSVTDANGVLIQGAPVSWESSNPVAVGVTSTGVVSALAIGSATVSATSGPVEASARVVSVPFYLAPNGVTVMCPEATVGQTGQVNGAVYVKRSRDQIDALVDAEDYAPLESTCTSGLTDMSDLFRSAFTFNRDISSWDVSRVTDMRGMFFAAGFNRDIGSWDVGNVTDMSEMFRLAGTFNQDISAWDVSNVVTMASMFLGARRFNQPIGLWSVTSVTDMASMLSSADDFDQPLALWDVSSVTDMTGLFSFARSFNQDLSGWDVSNVTRMRDMFYGASAFNQLVDSWSVGRVTDMHGMFQRASVFNQPLGTWDVSSVTNMGSMFEDAANFSQPIGSWNVSSVTNMDRQFHGARRFNQPLAAWNVRNVVTMLRMFSAAVDFDQDISGWDVSNVFEMDYMFANARVFNQDLSSWCVSLLGAAPLNFDAGATLWVLSRPAWGTCPSP